MCQPLTHPPGNELGAHGWFWSDMSRWVQKKRACFPCSPCADAGLGGQGAASTHSPIDEYGWSVSDVSETLSVLRVVPDESQSAPGGSESTAMHLLPFFRGGNRGLKRSRKLPGSPSCPRQSPQRSPSCTPSPSQALEVCPPRRTRFARCIHLRGERDSGGPWLPLIQRDCVESSFHARGSVPTGTGLGLCTDIALEWGGG